MLPQQLEPRTSKSEVVDDLRHRLTSASATFSVAVTEVRSEIRLRKMRKMLRRELQLQMLLVPLTGGFSALASPLLEVSLDFFRNVSPHYCEHVTQRAAEVLTAVFELLLVSCAIEATTGGGLSLDDTLAAIDLDFSIKMQTLRASRLEDLDDHQIAVLLTCFDCRNATTATYKEHITNWLLKKEEKKNKPKEKPNKPPPRRSQSDRGPKQSYYLPAEPSLIVRNVARAQSYDPSLFRVDVPHHKSRRSVQVTTPWPNNALSFEVPLDANGRQVIRHGAVLNIRLQRSKYDAYSLDALVYQVYSSSL